MGGMGRERIYNMKHDFKFTSKHSPQVKSAYSDLMEILSLVHDNLRKQKALFFKCFRGDKALLFFALQPTARLFSFSESHGKIG